MFTANDVPVRRGSTDGARLLMIDMPAGEEAETVRLMFEILGWQVVDAADPVDGAQPMGGARLHARAAGRVLVVHSGDARLRGLLARHGLDRLTLPPALPALEQLMLLAG